MCAWGCVLAGRLTGSATGLLAGLLARAVPPKTWQIYRLPVAQAKGHVQGCRLLSGLPSPTWACVCKLSLARCQSLLSRQSCVHPLFQLKGLAEPRVWFARHSIWRLHSALSRLDCPMQAVRKRTCDGVKTGNLVTWLPEAETGQITRGVAERLDWVVTLGGDGTVLWTCSILGNGPVPPLVPFAMGSLGFMTPFAMDRMQKVLNKVGAQVLGCAGSRCSPCRVKGHAWHSTQRCARDLPSSRSPSFECWELCLSLGLACLAMDTSVLAAAQLLPEAAGG